jgi:predicted TIM-barrel fold metal-dependent hydrolase
MYADELLESWVAPLRDAVPGLAPFDCHTHVGVNDPSGFSVTAEQLLDSVRLADCRAAVFPLKEPEGYREANLRAVQLADEHPDRLVAFCRIDPADEPLERAEEALSAGARGLKLHPAGEEFDIGDPRLEPTYELANQETLPIIVHAGPEIDGPGETALELCRRYPGLRLILAHDALTDLGWIYECVDEHPNLFFDTTWWGPAHTMALVMLIPPGRILSGSDIPYCTPLSGIFTTLRCGLQAGLSEEQLRLALGHQFQHLVEREKAVDAGPPPGRQEFPLDPLLERLYVTLLTGLEALQRGEDLGNALSLSRHACKVTRSHRYAHVFHAVSTLLDLYEAHADSLPRDNQYSPGWDLIAAAAIVARTPDAPLPEAP